MVGPERSVRMQQIQKYSQISVANIYALKLWSFFHQKFPIILLELAKIASNFLHSNYTLYRFIYWQRRDYFINSFAEIVFSGMRREPKFSNTSCKKSEPDIENLNSYLNFTPSN